MDLFSVGQIRLSELSVFNWGSFNGLHTASIDPAGTLITGDNGSGKSTFIDGLMALLLPAGKAMFNVAAAQGDRSDRSLLSYMRGSFGSAHDGVGTRVKSKREFAVITGLRAFFKGDDGSQITLAVLFWTMQPTNVLADVTRLYVVAKRDLSLKEMLDVFGETNTRALKQWLRGDPAITCCDSSFSDYQELYRKLLYMDNKNAPALLSRALGLKKIDDGLTDLIRELVLEPSTVKDDAKKVVDEFADLVAIHDRLVDARAQKNHLSKLPELSIVIEKSRQEFAELLEEKNSLSVYLGEVFVQLWSVKIKEIESQLDALSVKIKQAESQEKDANELVERRHEEYLQLGGDKIERLQREIEHAQDKLNRVVRDSSQYQENAEKLDLPIDLDERSFMKNQSEADLKLASIESDNKACQDQFADVSVEYSKIQSNIRTVAEEITEIEARPDSNIEWKFQRLRDELIDSLKLSKDRCLFIGELIDVKEEERHWQGAIERALGGLRTTMVVPSDCYSMVTRWLNVRHTGLHVRVQVVDVVNFKGQLSEFKSNGYLKKLLWREHPYREWLKNHLQRFDLQCVANTEELDRTPFSMTQQGLTHLEKGRFEKKDQYSVDDRRQWNLGFSNKSRLEILNQEKEDLTRNLKNSEKLVIKARQDLKTIATRKNLWEKIKTYVWDDINAPYYQEKLTRLKSDLQALEQPGGNLDSAKLRWESAKADLIQIQKNLKELSTQLGRISHTLQTAKAEHQKAQTDAEKGIAEAIRTLLYKRIGTLTLDHLDQKAEITSRIDKKLDALLEICRNKQNSAEKSAIGVMSSFSSNEKWQALTVDWQRDIASLPNYLSHLEQLENEGLPNLVEQFIERLNKHATQSLARIKTKLDSEREDVIERIEVINRVLKRTEFKSGSYLKLSSKKDKYPHVYEFESQLLKVLNQATSSDHEARFEQLVKVVSILEKASAPATSYTLESLRLLDPRYQMSFYAEELDIVTGEIRDVLASSSGKSGGEKESFAGIIVAASLAYVLTPDGHDRPVYCTVFLDEAFSNTAESVSRRVLRVFKELHLHINLITPYKNLNLARESARSLLIAERDPVNHDSRFYEITWEEIDQRMNEKNKKILAEATNFGVEII